MKNRSFSWKRMFLSVVATVLGLVLIILLGLTIGVNALLNQIPRVDKTQTFLSEEQIESILNESDPEQPGEIYKVVDPEELDKDQTIAKPIEEKPHIFNILLIGQDRRGGTANERSDTMLLVTVNVEKKTLTLTSFLRDMYIDLADHNGKIYPRSRLNNAYAFGGMEMLDNTLKDNFGVQVDHNIEVDFEGFIQIVDIVGGVDIELTAAEAEYMRCGVHAGMNHLDGAQTLNYARIREIDSDFQRTGRQRTVMMKLFEKIRYMNVEQLTQIVETVLPLATTDMTNADIIGYALDVFPILTQLKVHTQHIPAEGMFKYANIGGMAVILPDLEANRQLLQETIGEQAIIEE